MLRIFLYLISIPKTIFFNFYYLPFNYAIKLPFFISYNVCFKKIHGNLELKSGEIKSGMIRIGFGDVGIFDKAKSRTIWEHHKDSKIIFEGKASIGHGSKISVSKNGELKLGSNFVITAESSIICCEKISFGKDCLISWEILIMDTDFHKIINSDNEIINNPKEIKIGERVWIGCRTLILKGTTISNDTIIGANSFVNKSFFEKNTIVVGNPAEVRKRNVTWEA